MAISACQSIFLPSLKIRQILRGHYAYYGLAGNFRALKRVHRAVERYWYKMLCSRGRKGYFPWKVFHRIKERLPLRRPKLALSYRELQAVAKL
jgi:RNA-directed DNA polymerase